MPVYAYWRDVADPWDLSMSTVFADQGGTVDRDEEGLPGAQSGANHREKWAARRVERAALRSFLQRVFAADRMCFGTGIRLILF